jgi:nucleoside-diphosphate-sugar epimerase
MASDLRRLLGLASPSDIAQLDNVVAAVELALERGRHGSAYYVTDGEPRPFKELVSDLVATVGVDVPTKSVPQPVARMAARLMDRPARILRRRRQPPLTRWLVDIAGSSHRYDIEPARCELGYRPITSYEQGITEMREARRAA